MGVLQSQSRDYQKHDQPNAAIRGEESSASPQIEYKNQREQHSGRYETIAGKRARAKSVRQKESPPKI